MLKKQYLCKFLGTFFLLPFMRSFFFFFEEKKTTATTASKQEFLKIHRRSLNEIQNADQSRNWKRIRYQLKPYTKIYKMQLNELMMIFFAVLKKNVQCSAFWILRPQLVLTLNTEHLVSVRLFIHAIFASILMLTDKQRALYLNISIYLTFIRFFDAFSFWIGIYKCNAFIHCSEWPSQKTEQTEDDTIKSKRKKGNFFEFNCSLKL